MTPPAVPAATCPACSEFLPHACAPVVTLTRARFTGRRVLTVTDRTPPLTGEPPDATATP